MKRLTDLIHDVSRVGAFGLKGSVQADMLTSDIADKIADRLDPPPETLSFQQEKEYERRCLENERKARNRRQIEVDLYRDACWDRSEFPDPKKIEAIDKRWLDWLDRRDERAFKLCLENSQPTGFLGFLTALFS